MTFPVDLLADVSQEELERSAREYQNALLYSNPECPERLTLPDSTQVTINISNVGFVPLYGESNNKRILVLFSPSNLMLAIAVYLLDRWWTVEEVLKTANPARRGVLPVDTVGERIVLYVLNRFIYRENEMGSEEMPFLCHAEKDHAKILWGDGEAVGFYSVKATGSSYSRSSSRTYQLPVMDSIFVRKGHRGKGCGLLMLKDFVLSFTEASLGLKYPLSTSMYRVCETYLCQHPEDTDLLWEVERTGGPYQRTNIASKLQLMDLSAVSKNLSFTEESRVITEVADGDAREDSIAIESTTETTEETTVVRSSKAATGQRLRGSRRRKLEEITEERSGKSIRTEHIAAEAHREDRGFVQQETDTLHLQMEGGWNHQETGEDSSETAAEAEEALSSDQAHGDVGSQDRLKASPATEEKRRKEDAEGLLLPEEVCEGETLEDTSSQAAEPRETAGMSDGGRQQLEDEELNEEFGVKGTVLEEISAEPAEPGGQTSPQGPELEEEHVSETQEPPVLQRRSHRDRRKVHPRPRSTKERQHEDEGTQGHEAELEAGRPSGGKEEDKQVEENQENRRAGEETSTTELLADVEDDGAEKSEEDVLTSAEVRTDQRTEETTPGTDPEEEEPAEGRAVTTAADLHQPTASVPEEHHHTKDEEMPTLEHASVVSVDLRRNRETSDDEREELEPRAAERTDQQAEPASSEEGTEEQKDAKELHESEGKEESSHHNHEEEEEAPLVQTVYLRSGPKVVKGGLQEHEAEVVPAETKEEKQAGTNDGATGEEPAGEEQPAEEASAQPEINEEKRLEEDEAAVHLQEVSERKSSGEDQAEAEEQTPEVPPEAAEDQEYTADCTSPGTVEASDPGATFGASEEKQHEEEMDPQGLHLQRVTVVLVDLRNSRAAEEEPAAAEMEEQNTEEGKEPSDGPGKASDVPEEAVTTQTPQSGDDGEGLSADEEVPVVDRRVLRSGRKTGFFQRGRSAAATPQPKSGRAHANCEPEEQGAEEPKLHLEGVPQEDVGKEGEVGEEDDGAGAAEKEEDVEASGDDPSMTARAPRKTKRSAPATSRRESKRPRMQSKSEEEVSAEDTDLEEHTGDGGERENGDVDQEGGEEEPEAGDKETDVLSEEALAGSETRPNEQEENSLRETSAVATTEALGDADEEEAAPPDLGSHGNGVNATPGTEAQTEEKEPTSSGPGRADLEELAVMKAEEEANGGPEREEEEETTSLEKGMKTGGVGDITDETPAGKPGLETGAGMEEETTETDAESPTATPEEDHRAEGGAHEAPGFSRATEVELSHQNMESELVAMETGKDTFATVEPNTDEDEKASSSELEVEEEVEVDGETIEISRKVLRGRTVPALIITPKRKRNATPARTPKRRSRV